tara:strand:+ start:259 stop:501 length:243 start_codon:yes stop_codon:yes gene_type:complete
MNSFAPDTKKPITENIIDPATEAIIPIDSSRFICFRQVIGVQRPSVDEFAMTTKSVDRRGAWWEVVGIAPLNPPYACSAT